MLTPAASVPMIRSSQFALLILCLTTFNVQAEQQRARDLGIAPGIFQPGTHNAITDVKGVKVGHVTLHQGKSIHTGVTVVIPAEGNLRKRKVPAAIYIANGYGKLAGISQLQELGEIETPIALTNTLNVAEGIAGIVEWTLAQPGNEDVYSVNAVVGETNDGRLNDIRKRAVTIEHVKAAISSASSGPVPEGNVGAGAGTVAFMWKGGIGTSSRQLPEALGGWTLGVLVQSNYGGILTIDGVQVGKALNQYYLQDTVERQKADGSIMIVVATDAPLSSRNLERLAKRAIVGLARTGAVVSNGSGDYVIAFSNHPDLRRDDSTDTLSTSVLHNSDMSPLFQAVAEATEEAIYNALFMAEDLDGHRMNVKALPLNKVRKLVAETKQ